MKKLTALIGFTAVATLALAGCADPTTGASQSAADSGAGAGVAGITPFDVSTLSEVPEVAALVPADIKEKGILTNGASTDYAPGEFRGDDGQTPVGYDVDLVKAIAKVMGLKEGQTSHAEFPTILPALGTKFDVAASSFTITPERLEQVNMISYVEVGSAYAVAAGNPKGFDPTDPCGATIGVQNGTYQQDYAQELSDKCVADGKSPIEIKPEDVQTSIATKVIGGQYDATLADSTVIGFTVELAEGKLEQVGEVIESEPQGIAVAKDNVELAKAVQAAVQYLMDNGQFAKILGAYGAEDAALTTAELNPGK
ncbi:ABC transporter substrate-binding protein [Schaalia sp. Marseille-Q2122]|uniref:ABC transporter substrate-binding protein n=1 Tax=Schaalia sp. Marseille-Q2122 TaxID=2736604 RepID=UPI001588B9C5|nr:ABC transporter substrate-binding protein [Schaalia sp. Marseille-Q2122]